MILLTATDQTLELTTSSTSALNYDISYVDHTTSGGTLGAVNGVINTATTTTVLSAPASSTQRQIKRVSVRNAGSASQTITIYKDVAATNYSISSSVNLAAGDVYEYTEANGWRLFDNYGRNKVQNIQSEGFTGYSLPFLKIGTAPEAAGNFYCYSKDSGLPGAWSVGTSGIAGRVCYGTSASDAGCIAPKTSSNLLYVTEFSPTANVAGNFQLVDFLWTNNDIIATGTFIQTVNSVVFPPRDSDGTVNGTDVNVGLLVTTATTNAGAIANAQLFYDNTNGIGATGTMAAFPATAVIGTFVPFRLPAGDKGVKKVNSINLGTSLVTGAVSLVAYRVIDNKPVLLANTGNPTAIQNPGIHIYDGSCLQIIQQATATTATTVNGTVRIMER